MTASALDNTVLPPGSPGWEPLPAAKIPLLHQYVEQHATRGDPFSVLAALDAFTQEHHFLMTIGDKKGETLRKHVRNLGSNVNVIVELGCFVGYSSILLAHTALKQNPSVKVISFEINPTYASIAEKLIAFAGLSSTIEIRIAPSSDSIKALKSTGVEAIDVLFIDHWSHLYLSDLKLVEEEGLLRKGSVVMADNVLFPQYLAEYMEYLEGCGRYKTHVEEMVFEDVPGLGRVKDAVAMSVVL
ncbi:hypothetical protein HDV00_002653 [Rhizophlyctis rosea]|nr:hypothetical protein HDV00_002653 [Rhizophlyctis rosea]